jgi:hypothetical protein
MSSGSPLRLLRRIQDRNSSAALCSGSCERKFQLSPEVPIDLSAAVQIPVRNRLPAARVGVLERIVRILAVLMANIKQSFFPVVLV